jgi:hypothetical protein
MDNQQYHVIGMGSHADDLHYIGWTWRLLEDTEKIVADIVKSGEQAASAWVAAAIECGRLSVVEIEAAATLEAARSAAASLTRYFRSLGLDVVTDASE